MCSSAELKQILSEVTEELRGIFGGNLENVILYGSYARGDADEQSDIDIMALVSGISRDCLCLYDKAVSRALSRIEEKWDYDVLLSLILEDMPTFEKYADDMAFFRNVRREGISVV